MKRMMMAASLLGALLVAFVALSGEPRQAVAPAEAKSMQAGAQAHQAIAQAEQEGVVVGQAFDLTEKRANAAKLLVDTEAAGASCQITCSGGKVAGIVCNVGEMCQCSCMGGGPDCSCRNSN